MFDVCDIVKIALPMLAAVAASWVYPALAQFDDQPVAESVFRLTALGEQGVPLRSLQDSGASSGVAYTCESAGWQDDRLRAEGTFCASGNRGGWQLSDTELTNYTHLSDVKRFELGSAVETSIGAIDVLRFNVVGMPNNDDRQCAGIAHGYDRGVGQNATNFRKVLTLYVCTKEPWSFDEETGGFVGGITDNEFIDILKTLSVEGEFESLL